MKQKHVDEKAEGLPSEGGVSALEVLPKTY
jgi:hypothetical protein